MRSKNSIDQIIKGQFDKIKKKRPFIEELSFRYEFLKDGKFKTVLKARTNKKTIVVSEKDQNIDTSIKKAVSNIIRLLTKTNRYRKSSKDYYSFEGAA